MTTTLSAPALDRSASRIRRAGWLLFLLGLVGAGLSITLNLMRGPQAGALGIFTGVLWTAYSGLCGVSLLLGRRGRQAWAAGLILAGPLAIVPLTSLMLSGLGFTTGLGLAVLVALAANYFDLPRPQLRLAVAGGIVLGF